jgi:hypothetical protein
MSQAATVSTLQLFKNNYGKIVEKMLPVEMPLQKDIPFNQKQKVGANYIEAICLTNETGWTLSASADLFDLNPAISGVVKDATVGAYISVLPSVLPWGIASRTAGGDDVAFYDATKYVVKNNLRSHMSLQETLRLYGQAAALLGYVSYATATYRGASFVVGTGTLTLKDLSTLTFTNGVNTSSKAILFAPGQFASGIWVGREGVKLNQVDSTGAVVASGKLVSVNSELGYITVDFVPVAATAASGSGSYRICFQGMENAQDYPGIQNILSNTGTLFGINTAAYSLWQGNVANLQSSKLTLAKYNAAVADAVNHGGVQGEMTCYLNPRSFSTLTSSAAGYRMLDSSYKESSFENGFETIRFYSQNGVSTFVSHRMVKEGDAFALYLPSWSRSGSSEVSFSVPGMNKDIIFPLESQAGYCFRSFSDQYIFCDMPCWNIYFQNINDESST